MKNEKLHNCMDQYIIIDSDIKMAYYGHTSSPGICSYKLAYRRIFSG